MSSFIGSHLQRDTVQQFAGVDNVGYAIGYGREIAFVAGDPTTLHHNVVI
jgi:hypothetical protein